MQPSSLDVAHRPSRKFTSEHRAALAVAARTRINRLSPEQRIFNQKAAASRYWQSEKGEAARQRRQVADKERARDYRTPRERDRARRRAAKKYGYAAPPREQDCPSRPDDGLCQCCQNPVTRFVLDHDHISGAFRGWVCTGCNTGHGLADDITRLEMRVSFLRRAA